MNGISPEIWGTPCWLFLNCVARNYPLHPTKEEKQSYAGFIDHFAQVIPCFCKPHFREILIKLGWPRKKRFILKNQDTFSHFIHDVHNSVNEDLGKEILSYNEFLRVDQFRITCDHDNGCGQSRNPSEYQSQIRILKKTSNKKSKTKKSIQFPTPHKS
jgi:hypothetical protein